MAYNTKPVITDIDGNPISQYYNPSTDQYEPVEGAGGGNKVVLYNEDGTENNNLSLIPILNKLSQLTGTVIDEETRKSNELQRTELYNQILQMLQDGELKGDKGDIGPGLEFNWLGTKLGVRVEGDTEYLYVDLQGPQGIQGPPGFIENLNAENIKDALGFTPADSALIGLLESLTTEQKANLVAAVNEVDGKVKSHKAENAINAHLGKNIGLESINFTSDNMEGGMDELFQSVSDGKTLIARAITDKGVETDPSDTFQVMSNNIGGIEAGEGAKFATGTAEISDDIMVFESRDEGEFSSRFLHITSLSFKPTIVIIRVGLSSSPTQVHSQTYYNDEIISLYPGSIVEYLSSGSGVSGMTFRNRGATIIDSTSFRLPVNVRGNGNFAKWYAFEIT